MKGPPRAAIRGLSSSAKAHATPAPSPIRAREAIRAVEQNLEAGKRAMLVAMATGTGKTKTGIALLYRLLSAKRFQKSDVRTSGYY